MPQMIFVNLPVGDLPRATTFYEKLGFTPNPMFSNEAASCMVWSDTIFVMLLTHNFWRTFTSKTIPDAKKSAQVLLCLSRDDRTQVDDIVAAAQRAGGMPDPTPTQDMGFMYGRSFEDPDGHIWEIMWMDPAAAQNGPPADAAA